MKCYICDRTLAQDEIKYSPKYGHGNFDPCGHCLGIIDEVFEPLDEDEIDWIIENTDIEEFDFPY